MAEHTKGPWGVAHYYAETGAISNIYPESDDDKCICYFDGPELDLYGDELPPLEECEANAALMAASPDLLEACEATQAILDAWGPERRGHTLELLHAKLAAAIAKAKEVPNRGLLRT